MDGRARARLRGFLGAMLLGTVIASLAAGWPTTSTAGRPSAQSPAQAPPAQSPAEPRSATVPSTPETTSAAPQVDPCARIVDGLTPRRRLAQLIMVGVDPSRTGPAIELARSEGVGGIFLGGSDTTLLVDGRLAAVQAAGQLPLAVSVDEEGGRVQRVDALDGPVPSAREMAATMTPDEVRALARKRGADLRRRGVTVDFAPVVDVSDQPDDGVVGDRSFGSNPDVVTRYAKAFALGLLEGGVLPVVKHFPGHGRASGDSHHTAVSTPAIDELRRVDLVPYRRLLDLDPLAVMVGHLDVPGLTESRPASVSPATYRLLRDEFSFDGVVITDDLGGMRAVSARYPLPRAVLAALSSGADIALWSSGERVSEVLDVLERALADRTLPAERVNEALGRVLRVKGMCGSG